MKRRQRLRLKRERQMEELLKQRRLEGRGPRFDWSPRVYELEKIFEPYWSYENGLAEDAPQEAKDAFKEFGELVEKENWCGHGAW